MPAHYNPVHLVYVLNTEIARVIETEPFNTYGQYNNKNSICDLTMENGPTLTTKGNPGEDHCDTFTVLFLFPQVFSWRMLFC